MSLDHNGDKQQRATAVGSALLEPQFLDRIANKSKVTKSAAPRPFGHGYDHCADKSPKKRSASHNWSQRQDLWYKSE